VPSVSNLQGSNGSPNPSDYKRLTQGVACSGVAATRAAFGVSTGGVIGNDLAEEGVCRVHDFCRSKSCPCCIPRSRGTRLRRRWPRKWSRCSQDCETVNAFGLQKSVP